MNTDDVVLYSGIIILLSILYSAEASNRVTTVPGSEVTLPCYFVADRYRWQKYNNAESRYHYLTDTERYYGSGNKQMTILAIQSIDAGIYRCVLMNNVSAIVGYESTITVVVVTNGNWGQWSSWNSCTVTCGTGVLTRTRQCNNPAPSGGGSNCNGINEETRSCNNGVNCPVDGMWNTWSYLSGCSVTCGIGTISRTRECNKPPPSNGGQNCIGDGSDQVDCKVIVCPVDGHWTRWSEWSVCTTSCGGGNKTRTRDCTNPSPLYGGHICSGGNLEYDICSINDCPVALTSDGNSNGAIVGGPVGAFIVLLIVVVIVVILLRKRKGRSTEQKTESSNKYLHQAEDNVISRPEPAFQLNSLNKIEPNDQDNAYLKLERVTEMTKTENEYDELHVHVTTESDPDKVYCETIPDNSPEYENQSVYRTYKKE